MLAMGDRGRGGNGWLGEHAGAALTVGE